MVKKKQLPIRRPINSKIEEPKVEDLMEIGDSPILGVTLRQVLRGHTEQIGRIAWSPDGNLLATPSADGTIGIWNTNNGNLKTRITATGERICANWSFDGNLLATDNERGIISIWRTSDWEIQQSIDTQSGDICSIHWSPNKNTLASSSIGGHVKVWDLNTNTLITSLDVQQAATKARENMAFDVLWVKDGKYLIAASNEIINVWDVNAWKKTCTLIGHTEQVTSLSWSKQYEILASASEDQTIRLWDISTGKQTLTLEGHESWPSGVQFSPNDQILASVDTDGVYLWDYVGKKLLARVNHKWGNTSNSTSYRIGGLAFDPSSRFLATSGKIKDEHIIFIWELDFSSLYSPTQVKSTLLYTTAKLVLVGDSGVGKTGLGWRLAHDEFKEHPSTHGQQFWIVPELNKTRDDGTECEAVLWDLAGQPDYRLVHSLYLDDIDTAMILFDPSNRQEPLAGVDFWLNQLKDKDKKLRNSILVGARTDRGTSTLTDTELQAFCERNGITGGYISTSAFEGKGLPELMEKLKEQIPWDEMTTTVTTVTFKRIKEFVLLLKEKTERKNVIVKPEELRDQLQGIDKAWDFSDAEMMTAVGHLGTHGYVKVIHNSNGQDSILLAPDIMANLASSIVLEARRNPRGLGVLEEERLLRGEYTFSELNNLSEVESTILLDAVAVLFLERNICFRETFNQQTFLVFPSLINEKRPIDETLKIEEGASYRVKGAVENIYASLVVLLGYTNTFTRTHQWQNQAQYEMGEGEICGFQQSEYRNGEIELVLYYHQKTPDPVRLTFRGLFERFLSRRELEISRYQPVICHKCSAPLARNVVMDQLGKAKDFSFCHECGERLQLPNPEPVSRLSQREEVIVDVQQAIAQRRTAFEAALVRVKGLLRDQNKEKAPTCFISYAWGTSEHQRWVLQLAKDLRNAGIDVLIDRWNVKPGDNIARYIEQIMTTDYVIVVGTSGLLQKYNSTTSDPVVTAELEMLNLRLSQPNKYGHTILPILVEGNSDSALSPQLRKLVYIDFKQSVFYFRQLFDMIWRLYDLPSDNSLLEELQESMAPQKM